jgi:outer membrane lipoprotein-sorting protein
MCREIREEGIIFRNSIFIAFFIILLCIISEPRWLRAGDEPSDVKTIIERVDKLYRSSSSYSEVEMKVVSEHWERTLTMNMWTEGMNRTFIYVTSPKKDEGMATLRVKSEMWNYFPKINKVMKVPPSMMMGSWMGSDFTNDDLVKESSLLRDYDAALIQPDNEEPDYYYIELIPKKETPSVWGKIIFTIRKEDYIPVTEVFYNEKGEQMRVMTFKDIRIFNGRKLPVILEMVPLHKKGQKTIIRYRDVRFDEKFDDNIFSLRNLQRRR